MKTPSLSQGAEREVSAYEKQYAHFIQDAWVSLCQSFRPCFSQTPPNDRKSTIQVGCSRERQSCLSSHAFSKLSVRHGVSPTPNDFKSTARIVTEVAFSFTRPKILPSSQFIARPRSSQMPNSRKIETIVNEVARKSLFRSPSCPHTRPPCCRAAATNKEIKNVKNTLKLQLRSRRG